MDDVAVADDELVLGRPPRAPRGRPPRRVVVALVAVGVVAVGGGLTARHLATVHPDPSPGVASGPGPATAASREAPPSVAVIAGVCRLVTLDGLPSTVLDADPAVVAAVGAHLPGLADVRGGRVATSGGRYGVVLVGTFPAAGGPATLTLWTERAPGGTPSVQRSVTRTRFDHSYTVATDVVAGTATGWRVHALAVAPDAATAAARVSTADVLAAAVVDPELVR